MNKRFKLILSIAIWVLVYLGVVFIGFGLGMVYQQIIFVKSIAYVMDVTDTKIEVNFNATEFSNELNRTFVPTLVKALNQSKEVSP